MSTRKTQKNSCATCGKIAGIFICRGCSQNFCLRHTNDHREALEKQMTDIIVTHNQLKQAISDHIVEQHRESLMQQIDQWEQVSIEKIHQAANDVRQQLTRTIRIHADGLKEKLSQLTQQLNVARRDGEFFENDIKTWTEKLDQFKQVYKEQQKVQINQDKNLAPLISKISLTDVSNDSFIEPVNDLGYENGHNDSIDGERDQSLLRERGEYSSGKSSLRFKVEQYDANNSILFGIISKSSSYHENTYENPTLYGWTGKDQVYLAGKPELNYNGYKSDIRADDVFMLTMDCDRAMISLKNERTCRTFDLKIDINKCPFPWLPNVRLSVDSE